MKLTLNKKRAVVGRFKAGDPIYEIAFDVLGMQHLNSSEIEVVLRDYLNGKFSLSKPKPKSELDYPRRRG